MRLFEEGGNGAAGGDEIGLSDHVYKAPVTPEWKEAWDITRAVLVAIRDDVHRHKATMLLATLSNALQVNPDEMLRASYMKKIGVDTLFYPDQELARFATENDIPVLTTAPTLLAYATEKKMCLHGFATGRTCQGHWNAEGHAVAGRLMARALCGN